MADRQECAEHFEEGFTDPMTHIDPFESIAIQFFDITIKMSESLGTANSRFFDTFFGMLLTKRLFCVAYNIDLSVLDDLPLSWLLKPVLKIICLLLFLAFAAIFMVWCTPFVIKSAFGSLLSLPRTESPVRVVFITSIHYLSCYFWD